MFKDFLIYITVSTLVLSILYLFYKYAFYKLTYFIWNRFFLLSVIFVSLLLPIIKITFFEINIPFSLNNSDDILFISNSGQVVFNVSHSKSFFEEFQQNRIFNIWNILTLIYLIGFIKYFYVFYKNLKYIFRIKSKSFLNAKHSDYNIYKSSEKIAVFSFFKNIYVNEKFFQLSEIEQLQIIEHEKVHIKQRHTIDNILIEVINILFWFNPLTKRMKKDIKENHEFIVDNQLVQNGKVYDYSKLILKIKESNKSLAFSNSFAETQIVSRIKLMLNPEKERIRKIRFVFSMPVLILVILTMMFTINVFGNDNLKAKDNSNQFVFLIDGDYQIVSEYFRDKIVEKKDDNNFKYKISHEEITIQTASFTPVLSIGKGVVKEIDTVDNWGLEEFKITVQFENNFEGIYKGLEKSEVIENQQVDKKTKIGKTGDTRLYPTISFQLKLNDTIVDPLKYIEL